MAVIRIQKVRRRPNSRPFGKSFPALFFEAATMIVHSLPGRASYAKIDKVIVIFFADKDPGGKGDPLYRFEFSQGGDTSLVDKYSPICLFVNGAYSKRDSKLGRMIADVLEPDPKKMTTPMLRDRMDMLKNTEEGIGKMQSALEEYTEKIKRDSAEKARAEIDEARSRAEEAEQRATEATQQAEQNAQELAKATQQAEQIAQELARALKEKEDMTRKMQALLHRLEEEGAITPDRAAGYFTTSLEGLNAPTNFPD